MCDIDIHDNITKLLTITLWADVAAQRWGSSWKEKTSAPYVFSELAASEKIHEFEKRRERVQISDYAGVAATVRQQIHVRNLLC